MPKIRITFIRHDAPSLEWMIKAMGVTDSSVVSRFVRDDDNPDYIVASEKCLCVRDDCLRLKDYLRRRENSIFIFFTYECVDPDLNIFDYAFTMNPDFKCGDRVAHNSHYICGRLGDNAYYSNTLTREEAGRLLADKTSFCNFIYSHPQEPRDSFFHLLSQYKRIDSYGACLNNTGTQSTRWEGSWYDLSIKLKSAHKFSIAMENASYKGYTTEKIISSLQAHTVPIYWGDPAVADYINPKAFINCGDYSSFEEVVERVKEIDSSDDLWLDMVTQPWQTEQQRTKTLQEFADNITFFEHIFSQDIHSARRRPVGIWGDSFRIGFTGIIGVIPPLYLRAFRRIRTITGKFIPKTLKIALKKLLKMY